MTGVQTCALPISGVFVFLPWLSFGAVATGCVVGMVTAGVCRGIENMPESMIAAETPASSVKPESRIYIPMDTPVHRFSSFLKILVMLFLALLVLVFADFRLYLSLVVFLSVVAAFSRTPLAFLLSRIKKFVFLIAITFLLPVFFNSGTTALLSFSGFSVTLEGIKTGGIFAVRIVLLVLASALLMRTTSPEEMTGGLARVLKPLRIIGISEMRTAAVFSLAWAAFPHLWESVRSAIRKAEFHHVKNLKNLIPLLSEFITRLYLNANPKQDIWKASVSEKNTISDSLSTSDKRK